jgi:hypothetical protein
MEFVFLTVPPEVEEVDYRIADSMRTFSNSSISPVPTSKGELSLVSSEREVSSSGYLIF